MKTQDLTLYDLSHISEAGLELQTNTSVKYKILYTNSKYEVHRNNMLVYVDSNALIILKYIQKVSK